MKTLIRNEFSKLKRDRTPWFPLILALLPVVTGTAACIIGGKGNAEEMIFFVNNQFVMFFPMALPPGWPLRPASRSRRSLSSSWEHARAPSSPPFRAAPWRSVLSESPTDSSRACSSELHGDASCREASPTALPWRASIRARTTTPPWKPPSQERRRAPSGAQHCSWQRCSSSKDRGEWRNRRLLHTTRHLPEPTSCKGGRQAKA